MDPFSLIASHSSETIDIRCSEVPKPVERRKWTTKEDVVLISAWLNTSKDPIVSTDQKAEAFWKRIEEYFNASPQLVGSVSRDDRQHRLYALGVEKLPKGLERAVRTWFRKADNCLRVFKDIEEGRAPKVNFKVNNHTYRMAYYLTDGIYPNWAAFIQSISLPQSPKASLFAEHQESTRKDVERAFGVLQSRFAIVRNPALLWDKKKIGKIMRTCVILHNMIVENERSGYGQIDTSEFETGESSRSSQVQGTTSFNIGNISRVIRNEVRDSQIHARLKADLVENIWQKFGNVDE
ncbi:uncharacterized protein LOC130510036 [Raphanus sativus]|uniref:Uncharacterized protein LOC130510036 n=1 Tax=Raphanus sativus TaxID=3726 RepID=A0A9W3DEM6_RAPSA|nr:uncharacterized protein LOC130510036 [Raphanus sativus]